MKGIVVGVLLTLVLALVGAYFFVTLGFMPANADADPPALEEWAARRSLRASIASQAPKGAPPVPADDKNLTAGVAIYAENCAVCHGGPDGEASRIAKGLYQPAPQLAKEGVTDDPEGKIYWKVAHGIRFTGMPGFRRTLSEAQLWQVTLFLKHMDKLPPVADEAWKGVPKARD